MLFIVIWFISGFIATLFFVWRERELMFEGNGVVTVSHILYLILGTLGGLLWFSAVFIEYILEGGIGDVVLFRFKKKE